MSKRFRSGNTPRRRWRNSVRGRRRSRNSRWRRAGGARLSLVARGEGALGIVYATDAKVEPGVKIVGIFPPDSHPSIIYPVAATATARVEAADYLAFLRSSVAKTVFEKYGFTFLIRPIS